MRNKREKPILGSLKSLAEGFLAAAGLVWTYSIVALIHGGDAWLGIMYLLILLIPGASIAYLKVKNINLQAGFDGSNKWRNLLFSFQGMALAFWMFDIATTYYAIDVTGLALELNPLGWPLGILGALVYYAPTMVFSYVLPFRMKEKISLYAAFSLTLLTLGMSLMNLFEGVRSFQLFVENATLATGLRYEFLVLIVTVNLAVLLALRRLVIQPNPILNLKRA